MIGEVPNEALVMNPMAMEMQKRPIMKTAYLLARCDCMPVCTICCISTH